MSNKDDVGWSVAGDVDRWISAQRNQADLSSSKKNAEYVDTERWNDQSQYGYEGTENQGAGEDRWRDGWSDAANYIADDGLNTPGNIDGWHEVGHSGNYGGAVGGKWEGNNKSGWTDASDCGIGGGFNAAGNDGGWRKAGNNGNDEGGGKGRWKGRNQGRWGNASNYNAGGGLGTGRNNDGWRDAGNRGNDGGRGRGRWKDKNKGGWSDASNYNAGGGLSATRNSDGWGKAGDSSSGGGGVKGIWKDTNKGGWSDASNYNAVAGLGTAGNNDGWGEAGYSGNDGGSGKVSWKGTNKCGWSDASHYSVGGELGMTGYNDEEWGEVGNSGNDSGSGKDRWKSKNKGGWTDASDYNVGDRLVTDGDNDEWRDAGNSGSDGGTGKNEWKGNNNCGWSDVASYGGCWDDVKENYTGWNKAAGNDGGWNSCIDNSEILRKIEEVRRKTSQKIPAKNTATSTDHGSGQGSLHSGWEAENNGKYAKNVGRQNRGRGDHRENRGRGDHRQDRGRGGSLMSNRKAVDLDGGWSCAGGNENQWSGDASDGGWSKLSSNEGWTEAWNQGFFDNNMSQEEEYYEEQPQEEVQEDQHKEEEQEQEQQQQQVMGSLEIGSWSDIRVFGDSQKETLMMTEKKFMLETYGVHIQATYMKTGRIGYTCDLCFVDMNSRKCVEVHCQGTKHLKKLDTWKKEEEAMLKSIREARIEATEARADAEARGLRDVSAVIARIREGTQSIAVARDQEDAEARAGEHTQSADAGARVGEYTQRADADTGPREYTQCANVEARAQKYTQSTNDEARAQEYTQSANAEATNREYTQSADAEASARKYTQSASAEVRPREYVQSTNTEARAQEYTQSADAEASAREYRQSAVIERAQEDTHSATIESAKDDTHIATVEGIREDSHNAAVARDPADVKERILKDTQNAAVAKAQEDSQNATGGKGQEDTQSASRAPQDTLSAGVARAREGTQDGVVAKSIVDAKSKTQEVTKSARRDRADAEVRSYARENTKNASVAKAQADTKGRARESTKSGSISKVQGDKRDTARGRSQKDSRSTERSRAQRDSTSAAISNTQGDQGSNKRANDGEDFRYSTKKRKQDRSSVDMPRHFSPTPRDMDISDDERYPQQQQERSYSPPSRRDRSYSPALRQDRSYSPPSWRDRAYSAALRRDRSYSPPSRRDRSYSPASRRETAYSPVSSRSREMDTYDDLRKQLLISQRRGYDDAKHNISLYSDPWLEDSLRGESSTRNRTEKSCQPSIVIDYAHTSSSMMSQPEKDDSHYKGAGPDPAIWDLQKRMPAFEADLQLRYQSQAGLTTEGVARPLSAYGADLQLPFQSQAGLSAEVVTPSLVMLPTGSVVANATQQQVPARNQPMMVIPRGVEYTQTNPPTGKDSFANGPIGMVISRLASCVLKNEDDAEVAHNVVTGLLKALKESYVSRGQGRLIDLISETETKVNSVKFLRLSLKMLEDKKKKRVGSKESADPGETHAMQSISGQTHGLQSIPAKSYGAQKKKKSAHVVNIPTDPYEYSAEYHMSWRGRHLLIVSDSAQYDPLRQRMEEELKGVKLCLRKNMTYRIAEDTVKKALTEDQRITHVLFLFGHSMITKKIHDKVCLQRNCKDKIWYFVKSDYTSPDIMYNQLLHGKYRIEENFKNVRVVLATPPPVDIDLFNRKKQNSQSHSHKGDCKSWYQYSTKEYMNFLKELHAIFVLGGHEFIDIFKLCTESYNADGSPNSRFYNQLAKGRIPKDFVGANSYTLSSSAAFLAGNIIKGCIKNSPFRN